MTVQGGGVSAGLRGKLLQYNLVEEYSPCYEVLATALDGVTIFTLPFLAHTLRCIPKFSQFVNTFLNLVSSICCSNFLNLLSRFLPFIFLNLRLV